jgi:hypothetical protein
VKAMLLVLFDHRAIVHYEFAPEGQKINEDFYLEVLRRVRDAGSWLLNHKNVPPHTALSIRQYLAKY